MFKFQEIHKSIKINVLYFSKADKTELSHYLLLTVKQSENNEILQTQQFPTNTTNQKRWNIQNLLNYILLFLKAEQTEEKS